MFGIALWRSFGPERRRPFSRQRSITLRVESLEDRLVPAVDYVSNLLDGAGMGPGGSLRNVLANAARATPSCSNPASAVL